MQNRTSDHESGLHYNYHRYYDPATGRYLTPDPIGLNGGMNLFLYVQGDPINLVDPWGLIEWYNDPSHWTARSYDPIIFIMKTEKIIEPYAVAGGMIVGGVAVTAAGAITTVSGAISIPETGPAGVLVTTTGLVVTGTGITLGELGIDTLLEQFGYSERISDVNLLPCH